jgi:uncharacterized protein YcbX
VPLTLSAINRYPVKSCRGHAVQQAAVDPWGLAGDRRWLVMDESGSTLTAREHPRMLLVVPELRADGSLRLTGPDVPPLEVPVPADAELVTAQVGRSRMLASLAAPEAHAWFGKVLGLAVRLVYFDDPTRRSANPRFGLPTDHVSFADGYPLLLTSASSLDALNDRIAEGPHADEWPLPMIRFRPSVVVSGSVPWEEDGWRRVRVGAAQFRAVKGCDRCVLTMTDPDTGRRGKEPIASLARFRRWDGYVWFGMNLIPDTPGTTIAVADEVEVLEAVAAPDGPPR